MARQEPAQTVAERVRQLITTGRTTVRTYKLSHPPAEDIANDLFTAYQLEYESHSVEPLPIQNPEAVQAHCTNVAKWLTKRDAKTSLMILGGVGTGKTTMLKAVKYWMLATGIKLSYIKAVDLPIIAANSREVFEDMLKPTAVYDFLLIDDVGEEPVELNHYGNKVSLFSRIIEGRYEYRLPTIITSNLSFAAKEGASFKNQYSERVYDRMRETFNALLMTGGSYRE